MAAASTDRLGDRPGATVDQSGAQERKRGYWATAEYHADAISFLEAANSAEYGATGVAKSRKQMSALTEAAGALQAASIAMAKGHSDGILSRKDDPVFFLPTDPRNVWALDARLHAERRMIQLPLAGLELSLKQVHWSVVSTAEDGDASLEGHLTGGICWDGAVVLADFLCHPPAVLAAHHPGLARRGAGAGCAWSWAGKTVVELGCGSAALPSIAAALQGASVVLATDGSKACVELARSNVAEIGRQHAPARKVSVSQLVWGQGDETRLLAEHGVLAAEPEVSNRLTADVILCADVLYVLANPGCWGALLRTMRSLSGPETIVLLTYTERGHAKGFKKFLRRAGEAGLAAIEVAPHLLHPVHAVGCSQRLEQHVGNVQLFCLSALQTTTGGHCSSDSVSADHQMTSASASVTSE